MEQTGKIHCSIIIVNYNAGQKLLSALKSVFQNLNNNNAKVILIDNASNDGIIDLVAKDFPEVLRLYSDKNLGFGRACNWGVEKSKCEYLIFLNPDTRVETGWIEALLEGLENHSNVGLTTSQLSLMDNPEVINACGCDIHISGITLCRATHQPKHLYTQNEKVAAVSGAAFAIRRDLFLLLGGFDENMFLYFEDIDLSWRARLAGWDTMFIPKSNVLHSYQFRVVPNKIFWEEKNRYLMLLKSLKWRTLILLIPTLLLAELITWSFVLLRDRKNLTNKLRAYFWILAHWKIIHAQRKKTQALRVISDRKLLESTGYKINFSQTSVKYAATLGEAVFNPIFYLLRKATLFLVRW